MSEIITRIRNADVEEIMTILTDQQARQADVIVPSSLMRFDRGNLVISQDERTQVLTDDGVLSVAGSYKPTSVGDETLSTRIGGQAGFIKAMRGKGRHDVIDPVFNHLLHGGGHDAEAEAEWALEHMDESGAATELAPEFPEFGPFDGKIMLRLLKGDEGEEGVLRAALSSRYKIMDNLTVLLAVMEGIQRAGVNAIPSNFDLSDKRLYGRFEVPELAVLAPNLLEGYRSPFDGVGGAQRAGEDRPGFRLQNGGGWSPQAALAAAAREGQGYEPGKAPVVWAGFVISNSDVGSGSRTLSPQIRIQVCKNGLTLLAETDRKVHLGSEQGEGLVDWSNETQEKELALITAQARDLVATWMTPEWFGAQVAEIEKLAGVPVPEPEPVIEAVASRVKFSKTEAEGILAHFMRAGQYSSGGVANAVTSYSQTLSDADRAAELDTKAIPAMKEAASVAAKAARAKAAV
jgi:hypothetical protein